MLLALLAIRRNLTAAYDRVTCIDIFGFEKGGTYRVKVWNVVQEYDIRIGFISRALSREVLTRLVVDPDALCRAKLDLEDEGWIHVLDLEDGEGSINGTIQKLSSYHTFIIPCKVTSRTKTPDTNFNVELQLENPNTHLSMEQYPTVIARPIWTVLLAIGVSLWFVNWARMDFSMENKLHLLITVGFVVALVRYVVSSINVVLLSVRGGAFGFAVAVPVTLALHHFFSLLIMGYMAAGWCIVSHSIGICKIVWYMSLSLLYVVVEMVTAYVRMDWETEWYLTLLVEIPVMVAWPVSLGLDMKASACAVNNSDAVTRHSQEEDVLYLNRISREFGLFIGAGCLGAFWIVMMQLEFIWTSYMPGWSCSLVSDLLIVGWMSLVGWLCRMKSSTTCGYLLFDLELETNDHGEREAELLTDAAIGLDVARAQEESNAPELPWQNSVPSQPVRVGSRPEQFPNHLAI